MKVFVILISLLSFFNLDFNKKEINIESSFTEIDEIEYQYGNYKVIEINNNKIELLYNDSRIQLLNNIYHYKIIYDNEVLIVYYKNNINDYINYIKYNKGKTVINNKIDNIFIGYFDVLNYYNNHILVTSIDKYENKIIKQKYEEKDYLLNINAIAIRLDSNIQIIDCEIYGGKLNDYFEKIYYDYSDEVIYITGKKDQLSGYDFGNGGNGVTGYILCSINDVLEIQNYVLFKNRIINLEISDKIKIYTNFDFFVLNTDLTVNSSLKFDSESAFGMGLNKYWVACFNRRELKIYDFYKNKLVDTYTYKNILELDEVKINDNYLILKSKDGIFKGVFYNDLFSEKYFIYDDLQLSKVGDQIYGLPKDHKLVEITYEEKFDPLIFGEYDLFFNYESFSIKSEIKVLERCNVENGNIYPTGYNLFFSGNAYLNGEEIYNNHQINKPGEYSLKLIGKEEEKEINFEVYDMDVNFIDESLKNWDYEVRVNQELDLQFSYNNDGVIINKIIINNEEYDFHYDYENKTINCIFYYNTPGIYEHYVNKVIYEIDNQLFEHPINYYFKVRVLQDKISLNNNYYNDKDYFTFDINLIKDNNIYNNNYNNRLRFIKIVSDTNYYCVPIKEGNIILPTELNENQNLKFYLVYDVLGKLYEEQLLFEILYDCDNKNMGLVEVIKEENEIINIIIKLNNNDYVKEIVVNDNIEYQNNNQNSYILVVYTVMFIAIVFGLYKLLKVIKKRKEQKSINSI